MPDFALHAAAASKAVGRPVKVIRSREDDTRHSYYRPGLPRGGCAPVLGPMACLAALHAAHLGPVAVFMAPSSQEDGRRRRLGRDHGRVHLRPHLWRAPPARGRAWAPTPACSSWKASSARLGPHTAGVDDYQYRRRLLAAQPLALGVLDRGRPGRPWDQPAARQACTAAMTFNVYTGRGESFQTFVALVMELPRRSKAVCACRARRLRHRCGPRGQPGPGQGQCGGRHRLCADQYLQEPAELRQGCGCIKAISKRLPAACHCPRCRRVEVAYLRRGATGPPQVCGEVALGPVAPAVATALFHATGRRFRPCRCRRTWLPPDPQPSPVFLRKDFSMQIEHINPVHRVGGSNASNLSNPAQAARTCGGAAQAAGPSASHSSSRPDRSALPPTRCAWPGLRQGRAVSSTFPSHPEGPPCRVLISRRARAPAPDISGIADLTWQAQPRRRCPVSYAVTCPPRGRDTIVGQHDGGLCLAGARAAGLFAHAARHPQLGGAGLAAQPGPA
ncbi:hypothetical protein FQR65_LT20353 [Abscondita terminalis]|nr:hypothetical protein FQR65_LT20353 [Abscondita terminalis]